jgi:hypothetical protein
MNSTWRKPQLRFVCFTQNHPEIRGKYLRLGWKYFKASGADAKLSWRILIICRQTLTWAYLGEPSTKTTKISDPRSSSSAAPNDKSTSHATVPLSKGKSHHQQSRTPSRRSWFTLLHMYWICCWDQSATCTMWINDVFLSWGLVKQCIPYN